MPFKDALHTVSTDMILRLAAPHFLRPFWKKLDRVHVAFEDLKVSNYDGTLKLKRVGQCTYLKR